ncbi:MAG: hypothetical protein HY707_04560 [Ignavibacteriae bacterium]|nr:hypothetical protein [Ignavibacteriota bacterium]
MKTTNLFFMLLLLSIISLAQVPQIITHQGFLTRANGEPYDTTIAMTFRLFTDPTGGSQVSTDQTFSSVTVTRGVFNVSLSLSGVAFDKQYWLEVVAGGQTLSPRRLLLPSLKASRVE